MFLAKISISKSFFLPYNRWSAHKLNFPQSKSSFLQNILQTRSRFSLHTCFKSQGKNNFSWRGFSSQKKHLDDIFAKNIPRLDMTEHDKRSEKVLKYLRIIFIVMFIMTVYFSRGEKASDWIFELNPRVNPPPSLSSSPSSNGDENQSKKN